MAIPTVLTDAGLEPGLSVPGEDVAAAASLFRGLSDPTRLMIVRHLARGEHRVVDLVAHLGLAQSTISGHLACLRDCGLVSSRAQGRASIYSLARPELLDLLQAAEAFLDATGARTADCSTYGRGAFGRGTVGLGTAGLTIAETRS